MTQMQNEPKPPFSEQHQPKPGIEAELEPRPRYLAPRRNTSILTTVVNVGIPPILSITPRSL